MQVLNYIFTVIEQLLEFSTTELLGSAEIQKTSTSGILKDLDNFVKPVASTNQTNSTFDTKNLTAELANVAFSIKRDLFRYDVLFIAIDKEGHVQVSITTDNRREITPEIFTVIKIPRKIFIENSCKTLYSFYFLSILVFNRKTTAKNKSR